MKILTASQIQAVDRFTIENEPIPSYNLMLRASQKFVDTILPIIERYKEAVIFCGPGNNGGDGLCVAKLLYQQSIKVSVVYVHQSKNIKSDWTKAWNDLPTGVEIIQWNDGIALQYNTSSFFIDALFGTGLNQPLHSPYTTIVAHINARHQPIISLDVPSGLFLDKTSYGKVIKADQTITFDQVKLAFLLPENEIYVGILSVIDIGLIQSVKNSMSSNYYYVSDEYISSKLHYRTQFSHKGNHGTGLLIAGSKGMMGAGVLSTKAAIRSGIGKIAVSCPQIGVPIIQTVVPEAIIEIQAGVDFIDEIQTSRTYDSIAIGPGISTEDQTIKALLHLLEIDIPLIIDADALNIIAQSDWLDKISVNSIITPHLKEFERIFGSSNTDFDRIKLGVAMAKKHQIFIVIKGFHSAVINPDGEVYFNNTGNSILATSGSGDVLTGIILGLAAQGYKPLDACILGVHFHGKAGDHLLLKNRPIFASEIIDALYIPIQKNE